MRTTNLCHFHSNLSTLPVFSNPAQVFYLFIIENTVNKWTASGEFGTYHLASSEGPGEPAHPRSLARTFAARSYKQWVKRNLKSESQTSDPSEWLGMRS